MKRKRLLSLLWLFALVALVSAPGFAAEEGTIPPEPSAATAPIQSPVPAPVLPDICSPENPDIGVPEWQPVSACTPGSEFCKTCMVAGGVCVSSGSHCYCQ